MASFVNEGNVIPYTSVTALTAGDVVLPSADVIGVVVADTDAGELGALRVDGVYRFDTSATLVQGDECYYNATADEITDDSTDVYAGRVSEAVSTTEIDVKINFKEAPAGS